MSTIPTAMATRKVRPRGFSLIRQRKMIRYSPLPTEEALLVGCAYSYNGAEHLGYQRLPGSTGCSAAREMPPQ